MAGSKYHRNRFNGREINPLTRFILSREKKTIEANYEFLKCSINKNHLKCKGVVKPTEMSREYEIEILYDGINSPKVLVVNPAIEYNDDIHMFPKDNSLCLYHSETDNFYWDFRKHHLFDTIIPWTLEWFIFYELYLITGKWEHPFKPHKRIKEEAK